MTIRINRVYTRTGDRGETRLVGGKLVAKNCARIEAYGTVDELNSILGLARAFAGEPTSGPAVGVERILRRLQSELFDLGAELATPPEVPRRGRAALTAASVKRLEKLIDRCQADLKPLASFVLPGGGKLGSVLHQARTVCRRAERRTVALSREEPVREPVLKYLNRLSDLLFVLARWVGQRSGEPEYLWQRPLGRQKGAKR